MRRRSGPSRNVGEANANWNNGTSAYVDHYRMKLARIEKMRSVQGKCEVCQDHAAAIHHIDGSKSNHDLPNLLAVCRPCHSALHTECQHVYRSPLIFSKGKYVSQKVSIDSTHLLAAVKAAGGMSRLADRLGLCTETINNAIKKGCCIRRTFDRLNPVLQLSTRVNSPKPEIAPGTI